MDRDPDHHVVCLIHRRPHRIKATPFQENKTGLNPGPLLAIEIGLTLRNMKRVSRRDFAHVATTIVVDIRCRCYCRLERIFIPNAVKTAKRVDLVLRFGPDG